MSQTNFKSGLEDSDRSVRHLNLSLTLFKSQIERQNRTLREKREITKKRVPSSEKTRLYFNRKDQDSFTNDVQTPETIYFQNRIADELFNNAVRVKNHTERNANRKSFGSIDHFFATRFAPHISPEFYPRMFSHQTAILSF